MEIDKIIEKIDLEVDSVNAGHTAYRDSLSFKYFNNNLLENSLPAHNDGDEDIVIVDDTSSTFDEANFNIGFEEYYEDS